MATYTPGTLMPTYDPTRDMLKDWEELHRRVQIQKDSTMPLGKPLFSIYVVGNGFLVSFDGTLEHAHYAQNEQAIADLLIAFKAKEKIGIATRPADTVSGVQVEQARTNTTYVPTTMKV